MWHDPLLWTLASVAVRAVVVNVAYWSETASSPAASGSRLPGWVAHPAAVGMARGGYLLGIPLLALVLRVAPASDLGLRAPASGAGVALAGALAVVTWLALAVSRWQPDRSAARRVAIPWRWPGAGAMAWSALDGLWLEAHYALFRAGSLSVTAGAVTPAVFLSLGLLALEAWSYPWRRGALGEEHLAAGLSAGAGAALTSALAFAVTGSSLVGGVCQIGLRMALTGLATASAVAARTRPQPASLGADAS